MNLLNFEAATVESRIEQAALQLRFQHRLYSLQLDDPLTRGWALQLLSHSLRIVAFLEGHRAEIARAHAERILGLANE
jgi:uncharacterized caspase-like protein